MKKLSTMMAVLALVATGCDPYEDAPGGDPQILTVTASGWDMDAPVEGALVGDQWTLTDVPADVNGAIIVTTNKLLDGTSIQTGGQDPADAASYGNCVPANDWLTVTANGEEQPLSGPSDDPADPFQWFTCYYPGAATSSYGASVVIFRTYASQAPTTTAITRPLQTAFLDPAVAYVFTGDVRDDSGNTLSINVAVQTTVATPAGVTATPTAANSVTIAWTGSSLATSYSVARAPQIPDPKGEPGDMMAGTFADLALGTTAGGVTTFTDATMTDADVAVYYYRVTARAAIGSPATSAAVTTKAVAPTVKVASASATSLKLTWKGTNATSYTVYRSATKTGPFTSIGTTTTPTFTDVGLTTGTEYFYKVTATNFLGTTPEGDAAVVSGKLGAPAPAP
jgi:hypothetical protein